MCASCIDVGSAVCVLTSDIIVQATAGLCLHTELLYICYAGETLGCTAPVITEEADVLVFVADGRFHLEAMMIANPGLPAYRSVHICRIFW